MFAEKNKDLHGKIHFELLKDPGLTGNFECNLYKKADKSDDPELVYSKQASGKFPAEDYDTFLGMTESAAE